MAPLSLKIVLDNGAVTRKVKFDTRTTVDDAHAIVKDKFTLPDGGRGYMLFLRSANDDKSGVWLEGHRNLEYYMLRDGDSLDYLCRNRNLRVRMLDGTVKTMQVDEAKPVGHLMMTVCARIGITNYDEYGLCHDVEEEPEDSKPKEQATGTLTLKRKAPQKLRDEALDKLNKKIKTDDNVDWLDQHRTLRELGVDPKETLLLKRRLFYSDRNVDSRDPVQLNLLYVQTRDAILSGQHTVTEEQAADCKMRWINIRDVHRRILRKSLNGLPGCPLKSYKYEEELKFMRPFYRDVIIPQRERDEEEEDEEDKSGQEFRTTQWDSPSEDNLDIPQVTYSDEDKPAKKVKSKRRKYAKRYNSSYEDEKPMPTSFIETQTAEFDPTDSVDAFLLSIGATLKTFSPYHLNIAKTKIFSVVQEHDLRQIVENDNEDHSDVKVSASDSIYISQ